MSSHFFERLRRFVVAIARTWGARVTGGLFIGLLGIWQLTGHSLRPWAGWAVAVVGLLVACFEVWNDQQGALEAAATEPSELVVTQKTDPGYSEVKRYPFVGPSLIVTMLVSNRSSKPNSVLGYEALITKADGTEQSLAVEQGQTSEGSNEFDQVELYRFGITPLNIPPFNTVETILQFLDFIPTEYRCPYELKITVVDMFGNRFTGTAEVEKQPSFPISSTRTQRISRLR